MGKELGKEFYNEVFSRSDLYKKSYKDTPYITVWSKIVGYVNSRGMQSILELGCGTGQLAHYLAENGFKDYLGVDFSSQAISMAQDNFLKHGLKGSFISEDINKFNFDSFNYDCVISTAFLEHIGNDVDILSRVRSGSLIIGTLPNKDSAGHVHFYPDSDEVSEKKIKERYKDIGSFISFEKVKYSGGKNHDYLFIILKK